MKAGSVQRGANGRYSQFSNKKRMVTLRKIILYLWQLPQNLLGLAIIFFNRKNVKYEFDHVCVKYLNNCGISLGKRIILDQDINYDEKVIKHEQGHQKQSLYLGWLYLVVIGIPSAIGNVLHRFFRFNYFKQPWERWADRLGGVER